MLTELWRVMDEYRKNFNKETENIRSHRAEEYNKYTEKFTRGFGRRLDEMEESVTSKTESGIHPIAAEKKEKSENNLSNL